MADNKVSKKKTTKSTKAVIFDSINVSYISGSSSSIHNSSAGTFDIDANSPDNDPLVDNNLNYNIYNDDYEKEW